MFGYNYEINVYTIQTEGSAQIHSVASGEVQADRYSAACRASWPLIGQHCNQVTEQTGLKTAVGDIHVYRQDGFMGD